MVDQARRHAFASGVLFASGFLPGSQRLMIPEDRGAGIILGCSLTGERR